MYMNIYISWREVAEYIKYTIYFLIMNMIQFRPGVNRKGECISEGKYKKKNHLKSFVLTVLQSQEFFFYF